MRRSQILPLVVAATSVAVVTACGGADNTSSTSESFSSTIDPTTSVPDIAAGSTTDPTTPVTDPAGTVPVATTTPVVDVTDSTPWLVDLTDPTGPLLDTWVDRTVVEPTPSGPPDGLDARLAWVYEHLIGLWRGDLRLPAIGMNDTALDRVHRETAPGAVVDVVGAAASMLVDSYVTIAASSEQAATPGSPGEPLFAAWSEYAQAWVRALETARSAMVDVDDLEPVDQTCFLAAVDGDDGCEGAGAELAGSVLTDLDDRYAVIDEVEIDAPGSYAALGLDVDECRAWDDAVAATGLTADEELRIWLALDDHDLDVNFVSLSECGWVADREEDAVADDAADEATFLVYLTAVADAIVASGYDGDVAEMADGAEDERRYYESVSAEATGYILSAARDAASQLWSTAWSPAFATKLYVVAGIEIDDWVELDDRELDWDDLGNRICDGWTQVVEQYSADQAQTISAAVSDLGLDGTLIPEGCD